MPTSPTNGSLATILLSPNSLLILAGLLLLLINLILTVPRLRAGKPGATLLNVVVAVIACALLVVGIVRFAFSGVITGSDANAFLSQTMTPLFVAIIGGVIVLLAAMSVYRAERDKDGYDPARSNGLLHVGSGLLVLVAAVAIPLIPYQLGHAGTTTAAAAAAKSVRATPVAIVAAETVKTANTANTVNTVKAAEPTDSTAADQSPTPRPVNAATALPTLTPTMSETPIILYTQVAYVSTYAVSTTTKCTLTANATTYLRGDPSEKMMSIGSIVAGSLLYVNGRTANHKWWSVLAPTTVDASTMIQGWVRADYVTADAACTDQEVPALDATETATPSPTATGTAKSASSASSANTATSPCTLMTVIATSLRPDPSKQQVPLAQIPERTALTPTSRSTDGGWWQVTFGGQMGWVGGSGVMASASCASVPTQTR